MTMVVDRTASEKTSNRLRLLDLSAVSPEAGVTRVIERGARSCASDLFIVTNEQHVAVQVRLRGSVEQLCHPRRRPGQEVHRFSGNQAGMDVSDYRKPHDGRWIFEVDDQRSVDLRINVVPTLHGDDLACRLLDRDAGLLSLDRLGMTARQPDVYRPLLEQPGGMILFTGPTGSGKTVTLYASLRISTTAITKFTPSKTPSNMPSRGCGNPRSIPRSTSVPTKSCARVLRQAPDVCMIGEIRDETIAQTAAWAANSGMLDALDDSCPVRRRRDSKPPRLRHRPRVHRQLAVAAVSQRLMRTLCPACQQIDESGHGPDVHRMMEEIKSFLPGGYPTARFTAGSCEQCQHTGYAGTTAIYEIMPISDHIRDLILDNKPTRDIHGRATYHEGMLTLRQAALLKLAQGRTTVEEVRRVVPGIAAEFQQAA